MDAYDGDKKVALEEEQSPIEQVALVVFVTDDPSLPVFTFHVWVLGCMLCVLLMFVNTFFSYRMKPFTISSILAQILVLSIGKFMEATPPSKKL